MTDERYLLVCLKSALERPAVQRLNTLAGYQPDHPGEVAAMKRLLPWWTS